MYAAVVGLLLQGKPYVCVITKGKPVGQVNEAEEGQVQKCRHGQENG